MNELLLGLAVLLSFTESSKTIERISRLTQTIQTRRELLSAQDNSWLFNGGCPQHFSALISSDKSGSLSLNDCYYRCKSNTICKSFGFGREGVSRQNWCNLYSTQCTQGGDYDWAMYIPLATTTNEIFLRTTIKYNWIWDDRDSGSDADGSFWKPNVNVLAGESFLSFVNVRGSYQFESWSYPNIASYIITNAPDGVLKEPQSYQEIWNDAGSGGKYDVYFYQPIPYSGYVCFGDFISRTKSVVWDGYKCVRLDYVNQVNAQTEGLWNDKGSGADHDGQVVRIKVDQVPYSYDKTRNSYTNSYPGPYYSLKNTVVKQLGINVKMYAPILKFDGSAEGYPMNGQTYLNNNCGENNKCQNNILDVLSNPTYYRILQSDLKNGNFDIIYWWFYGYQNDCGWTDFGEKSYHTGDWERVIVHVRNYVPDTVTYYQHNGRYTTGQFQRYGPFNTNPVVYVGKVAHGSYYDERSTIGGGCGYFYDWRNPGPSLNSWDNLIDLSTSNDNWIKQNIYICCSNPLTEITVEYGCDSCGCWKESCNSDSELFFPIDQCVGWPKNSCVL